MTRNLTVNEIEQIVSKINSGHNQVSQKRTELFRNRLRNELKNVQIYPDKIPELEKMIEKQYFNSLVAPGETVGILAAQSIGERQTQLVLNSVEWDTQIMLLENNYGKVCKIGKYIDNILKHNSSQIQHIPENRTQYLSTKEMDIQIPSTDENGSTGWYKVNAVMRHLPVGKLISIETKLGRRVTATRQKSFLRWNGTKFEDVNGSDLKVGDIVPTTSQLPFPKVIHEFVKYPSFSYIKLDREFGYLLGKINHSQSYTDLIAQFCKRYNIHYRDFWEIYYLLQEDTRQGDFFPEILFTAPKECIQGYIDACFEDYDYITAFWHTKMFGLQFLLTYFGTIGQYKHSLARDSQFILLKEQTDKDVYFDEIISIQEVASVKEYVYDFEVEHTKNFQIFNGLNCRDSFHVAGQAITTVVTGVSRFAELLNATKNSKNIQTIIHPIKPFTSLNKLQKTIKNTLEILKFEDLIVTYQKQTPKKEWYSNFFKMTQTSIPNNYRENVSFTLDAYKLYKYHIYITDVAKLITNQFDDVYCIASPNCLATLDVWFSKEELTVPEASSLIYLREENKVDVFIRNVLIPNLNQVRICGIDGIEQLNYLQDNGNWLIQAIGSNLKQIMSLKFVDKQKTYSNNIWEMYETLGIEAVRELLINEFMGVISTDAYINVRHVKLLVDTMLFTGTITSISRYGMQRNESGPLTKSSFEESLEHFLNAGGFSEVESTNGVSASIMCGKPAYIGSGLCELKYKN